MFVVVYIYMNDQRLTPEVLCLMMTVGTIGGYILKWLTNKYTPRERQENIASKRTCKFTV